MPMRANTFFPAPSRSNAFRTLDEFLPKVADYASARNFDRPGHAGVSRLSPFLSRRMLTEEEVCRAVLDRYPYARAEKFVQEVCWRTYWKGWLQQRPSVWTDYRSALAELTHKSERKGFDGDREVSPGLPAEGLARACAGRTGIECFDYWANELVGTNYLHNHARMWFASIWIFTLGLPWELGADFFFRHLLDADPASNTLGWRWVAGLQTAGKHYVARAGNIARYTEGRFDPAGQLNENAEPPTEVPPHPAPRLDLPPPETPAPDPDGAGLLLLGDDLSPETGPLRDLPFRAVAAGWDASLETEYGFAAPVVDFSRKAIEEALDRSAAHYRAKPTLLDSSDWAGSALAWADREGLRQLFVGFPAVGPWSDRMEHLCEIASHQLTVIPVVRQWDRNLWPHAKAGFFRFRKHLPPSFL